MRASRNGTSRGGLIVEAPYMIRIRGLWARLTGPLARASGYLIATEIVAGALGLVFWIIAARRFTDADIGLAATLISSATFLATLSTLGFNISLVRFIPEGKLPVVRLINSAVTIASIVAVGVAVAFGASALAWLPALSPVAGGLPVLALFPFFTAGSDRFPLFGPPFLRPGPHREA